MSSSRITKIGNLILSVILVLCIGYGVLQAALPEPSLRDFAAFVMAARSLRAGTNPYAPYPVVIPATQPYQAIHDANQNPPISLVLFAPLAYVDLKQALWTWRVVSAALYGLILVIIRRSWRDNVSGSRILWAVALTAFWTTLREGQIYMPLLLLEVGALLCLDRGRWKWAGFLMGILAAIRPNFAVWPALLLFSGLWQITVVAAATVVALSVVPVFLFGPPIYASWISALQHACCTLNGRTNSSFIGIGFHLGVPVLGYTAAVLLLAGLAFWCLRSRPKAMDLTPLALTASLLASPETLVHYALFLLPVFLICRWNLPILISAAILLLPSVALEVLVHSYPSLTPLLSIYSLALVLFFIGLVLGHKTNLKQSTAKTG